MYTFKLLMLCFCTCRIDKSQTGHILGKPESRGDDPFPERSLSPAVCCIIRAILHSALLWHSYGVNSDTDGLMKLIKFGLDCPQDLPKFFWGHLQKDIQLLARALGKNIEESAIVVHLVLRNIVTLDPKLSKNL